jgi:ADP-heptose:LPS heptosyltransferase
MGTPKEVVRLEAAALPDPRLRDLFGRDIEDDPAPSAEPGQEATDLGDGSVEHTVHITHKWITHRLRPAPEKAPAQRITVYRGHWSLGDITMTEPVVRGLREQNPGAEITYIARDCALDLVRMFSDPPDIFLGLTVVPVIRESYHAMPHPMHAPWLLGCAGSRMVDLLCPAGRHEDRWKDRTYMSRVECFCEEAGVHPTAPALHIDDQEVDRAREWLKTLPEGAGERRLVLLSPVAMHERRCWPLWRWSELSRLLWEAGLLPAVLSHRRLPGPFSGIRLEGLSLRNVSAFMRLASLHVSTDTGGLHMASALGCPTLSLWGSTSPTVTLRGYHDASWIWEQSKSNPMRPSGCQAPCYHCRELRGDGCDRHCPILHGIQPMDVARHTISLCGR